MSENVIQTSFAAGELSPSLFARIDFAKYHSGAARMRNFFVDYRSGASTRPGTEFIRPTVQGQGPVRLVRFQQSVSVTYALEFGHHYLRFVTQGGSVVEPASNITGVNPASSAISVSGSYNANDLIFISGVSGTTQINDVYFLVGSTGSSFTLINPLTGNPANSAAWGVYTGGGTVQRVFTISTPYASSELALLKFSQKASQLNITHPSHPAYILTLISATNWTLVPASFGAAVGTPGTPTVTSTGTGQAHFMYKVAAVDVNGRESPASPAGYITNSVDIRATAGTNSISWPAVTGAFAYNVYKAVPTVQPFSPPDPNGEVGFIGTTQSPVFYDPNINADFAQVPPIHNDPFTNIINPQCSSYFQQRLVYANGGGNNVDRFWMSKPGDFYNFDISNPSQSDDSVEAELVSLEVNEIKSMIPMPSGLVMLTTKGAWQVSGGAGGVATQGGPITPTSLTATSQAYIGANDVPPILLNYDIFFVQQKGSIIRDLSYNIYANIYTGNDISILSNHLFYGHQVLEWAYAEEPFKVIWAVREDGVLLSLTVVKEQDMYGWARHDTMGYFRSVCTVTEGMADATYVVVDRVLPNNTVVKQIERIMERSFPFGVEDAWCVDAGAKTDSNEPNATLTPAFTSNGNVIGAILNITSDVAVFSSAMVGWVLRVDGGIAKVTGFTNNRNIVTQITQPLTNLLPDDLLGRPALAPPGTWAIDQPFTVVSSLDHLEGQNVSILADGGVINGLVVHNGSVTLPTPVTKALVGLGFQAQLQTMPLDVGNEQNTIQGKRKKVGALTVRVKDSRGVKAGRTFQHLVPIKELNKVTTPLGIPVSLITADERIVMDPLWDVPGQICLQVDDPLPATVLGVIPEILVGDTVK
jgi:hypothetical protein